MVQTWSRESRENNGRDFTLLMHSQTKIRDWWHYGRDTESNSVTKVCLIKHKHRIAKITPKKISLFMCESEHLRDEVALNPPVTLEFKYCLSQISWDLIINLFHNISNNNNNSSNNNNNSSNNNNNNNYYYYSLLFKSEYSSYAYQGCIYLIKNTAKQ